MKIEHKIETIILFNDLNEEIGELKYKVIDNEIVLMGTHINERFRGNGYFNILLSELVKNYSDKIIYICCIQPFIFQSIERFGFKKIDDTIPFWNVVSNGTNFKLTTSSGFKNTNVLSL